MKLLNIENMFCENFQAIISNTSDAFQNKLKENCATMTLVGNVCFTFHEIVSIFFFQKTPNNS